MKKFTVDSKGINEDPHASCVPVYNKLTEINIRKSKNSIVLLADYGLLIDESYGALRDEATSKIDAISLYNDLRSCQGYFYGEPTR